MPKFTYWESLTPEPPNLIGAVEPTQLSLTLLWQFNSPPLIILLSRSIIINKRRFPPLIRIYSSSRFITQCLLKYLMKNLIFPRFTHINLQQDHIQCDYQQLHLMELPTNVLHLLIELHQQPHLIIHQQSYHHYNH